jgi:RNA polymerase sigma-70 factor (ECF subfamily)
MRTLSLGKRRIPLSTDPEPALVAAAQRDRAAFAGLYRLYVTRIYRYIYSRVGAAAEAEDLTSQVFVQALEGLAGYREQGHFSAWLFSIARRKVADHHRRRPAPLPLDEATAAADQVDPLGRLVQEEALERLAALVAGLGEEEQELLRLRFAGELSYGEVGAVVGRSEPAVKMAMHRLLRRLEARWEAKDA